MGAISVARGVEPVDPRSSPKDCRSKYHMPHPTFKRYCQALLINYGEFSRRFLTFQLETNAPKAGLPHEGGC
jgi:hypothetical protein